MGYSISEEISANRLAKVRRTVFLEMPPGYRVRIQPTVNEQRGLRNWTMVSLAFLDKIAVVKSTSIPASPENQSKCRQLLPTHLIRSIIDTIVQLFYPQRAWLNCDRWARTFAGSMLIQGDEL